MNKILLAEIHPLLRHAQMLTITDGAPYGTAKAYDNRLFLCIRGGGQIIIEDTEYQMQPGALLLWGAGLAYQYAVSPEASMTLVGFNFDYTQQSAMRTLAIPPAKSHLFEPAGVTEQLCFSDAACLNAPLYLQNMLELKLEFLKIKDEFTYKKRRFEHRCSAFLSGLLAGIVRSAEDPSAEPGRHGAADEIIAYIQANYNTPLSNQQLGQVFGYHPGYIGRLILRATGISTHQYILNYRISRAIDFLQSGEANVSQACEQCGFRDLAHFSKCFKAKTGHPPSDFLR